MHRPVMSWADYEVDACTYCMGSKVSSLSPIYLYSIYFAATVAFGLGYLRKVDCSKHSSSQKSSATRVGAIGRHKLLKPDKAGWPNK
jgi:hypothetical protein